MCVSKESENYKEARGGERHARSLKKERWKVKGEERDRTGRRRERERDQAYEQRVTAQSLEEGKPTQEVSKSNLWEFAQQIVKTGA